VLARRLAYPCATDAMQTYRILVESQLDEGWRSWLEGVTLEPQPDGSTLLTGPIADQAALFGLLIKLRDMGVAIRRVDQVDGPEVDIGLS
jgi:hypothetical protein